MTLATILTEVADDVGIGAAITTFIGNNDETARRLLALAQKAGKLLARMDWTALQIEHTFSTVASVTSYALPSDYEKMVDGTFWNRTDYMRVRGGQTAQQWQQIKSQLVNPGIRDRFRIKIDTNLGVRRINIDPTPTAVENLVFEYVSTSWCEEPLAHTGQNAWVLDTDVARIDEFLIQLEVIWRLRRALGIAYLEDRAEAEREIARAFAADWVPPMIDMSGPARSGIPAVTAESGFG